MSKPRYKYTWLGGYWYLLGEGTFCKKWQHGFPLYLQNSGGMDSVTGEQGK